MVTSLVTSIRAHRGLISSIELNIPNTLYLVPWHSDWNDFCEFRVFVHEGRVTCFSQYVWSRDVGWNRVNMEIVAPRIVDYCNDHVITNFTLVNSFVVDLIVIVKNPVLSHENKISIITSDTDFTIELVELNSFGSHLASGAALFHWLNDNDTIYGVEDKIVARYVEG